ncbi:hypothetical protein [Virgibacillus halodenitrificans]|uniref:hypothetical protein n=1 Tax=Virgibacillus halodenitrificans TaxID=1482 RepID=UPI000303F881|nr:hypothetical protein [Virgibacillus halodenitrificans]
MKKEVFDVKDRKVVQIGDEMFTVDIACTKDNVYIIRGENNNRTIITDWVKLEDASDPVKSAVSLMEFEVENRMNNK